jgi:hypothetical protein
LKTIEAVSSLPSFGANVNFWNVLDVEAGRPSHCAGCGRAAHRRDGRLRLHGHGVRRRCVWGPLHAGGEPALHQVQVRRYRCDECGAVRTAHRPGLGQALRYSLAAIALSFALWALWRVPAAKVRDRVSPLPVVGASDAGRWRSLRRWARRAGRLFGVPSTAEPAQPREVAARAAHAVRARGPTDLRDPLFFCA